MGSLLGGTTDVPVPRPRSRREDGWVSAERLGLIWLPADARETAIHMAQQNSTRDGKFTSCG
jgi:hypothetical protein